MGLENIRGTWKNADYPNVKPCWQKLHLPRKIEYKTVRDGFASRKATRGTVRHLRLIGNAVVVKKEGSEYYIHYHKKV
jgi:hypothetical protein